MKKKVLFVFHDSRSLSGANASMLDLLDGLIKIGNLQLFALIPNTNHGLLEALKEKEVNVHEEEYFSSRYEPCSNPIVLSFRWAKSLLKTFFTLYAAIKFSMLEGDFDLVYSNSSDGYMGAFISLLKRKKLIWHIREFGLEDQNRKHCISDFLFKRYVARVSEHVVFISYSLKKKYFVKDNYCNNSVIYNDVRFDNVPFEKQFNLNTDKKLSLLIVGTLCTGKGQREVIDSIKILRDQGVEVNLGIAGDDDNKYAIELKRYANSLYLSENVKFLGFCSDIRNIRKHYDIAVISSISEAFGRVTIEAMLSKMLVVARKSGANVELIDSKSTGFLYSSENSFIEIIKHIDANRQNLKKIALTGYKASMKYTEGSASRAIDKIIDNITL